MPVTLLRSFSNLPEAEDAVQHLTDAGVRRSCMTIDSLLDETGGTEGNFAVGNAMQNEGLITPQAGSEYDMNFACVEWRGTILLTVVPDNEDQQAIALTVLEGRGRDPQQVVP